MKQYTEEEKQFIIDNWDVLKIEAMAEKIHHTPESIRKRAHALGLKANDLNRRTGKMKPLLVAKVQLKWDREYTCKPAKTVNPTAGKTPVRIDEKTVVFIPDNATDEEKERIIKRLSKRL